MTLPDVERVKLDYERDGVAFFRRFLSPLQVDQIRAAVDHYCRIDLPHCPNDARTYEADGQTIRNLWRLEQHCEFFRQLVQIPRIQDVSRLLLQSEPVLQGIETFNKPARIGSSVPWHQDNAYFCRTPPDMFTLWIAIDPVTPENGPVRFLKGSHRHGVLPTRPSGIRGNSIGLDADPEETNPLVALLESGDATVHHCNTIHCSDSNASDRPRLALLFVFRGSDCRVDPVLHASYMQAVTANPPG